MRGGRNTPDPAVTAAGQESGVHAGAPWLCHGHALSQPELAGLVESHAWIWESDAEHRITSLSPNYLDVTGIDPSEVIGRSRLQLMMKTPRPGNGSSTHLADLMALRSFRDFIYETKSGNERCRWISVSGVPRFDDAGVFLGYRGIGRNVTPLMWMLDELGETRRQLALHENRDRLAGDENRGMSHAERLMQALDAMKDSFCYYDANDELVLFNESLVGMYAGLEDMIRPGCTFEALIDKGLERGVWVTGEDGGAAFREEVLGKRRRETQSETLLPFRDGRWVMHREMRMEDGGVIGVCTDVTDYKRREMDLAKANAQTDALLEDLRRSLDAMTLGVVILDAKLNTEMFNKAFHEMWKLPAGGDWVGKPFAAVMDYNRHNGIYEVNDEDWDDYVAFRLDEIRRGDVQRREFRRADGCTMVYSVTSLSGGKRLISYYDITPMKHREAQLAEALETAKLAEAVVDSVPNPMFVKDSALRFVMANKAFADIFAMSPRDLVGKKASDVLDAHEAALFEENERQVLVTGQFFEEEEDFEIAGVSRSRMVRKNRVQTTSGTDYVACSIFDITDLKRRESESQLMHEYLAGVLETLPAAIIIYDKDDRFLLANRKLHDMVPLLQPVWKRGTPFREALVLGHKVGYFRTSGDPDIDALYDVDFEAWAEAYTARRHSGAASERLMPDGRWFKVFDTRTADGSYVGVRLEITELKERERALKTSMAEIELYKHVLDELPVSAYVKSQDLEFQFVNKTWCSISGVPKEEALGRTDRDFFGEEGAEFAERDREVLATGRMNETEEVLTHRDGTQRHLIAKKNRLVGADGSVYLIGSSTDISEMKQREAELQEAQERAIMGDRAKSEFLANMSHEIRTPMNGVLGMAELLAKTELDARQKTFTDIIAKSGNALLTIINDILDFSKIDAGQLVLDPAPFQLAEAIEDVATLVATRAKEKDLELIVRVQPGLPESFVGDVGRIRQIITNLLGNAVKFTDSGHVLVDVTGETSDGETRLHVAVTDTGIGIPKEKLRLVFDKFSQVDASSTRRHEGTGLGLAITSRLVALMDGEIGVSSEEGEGSTFWFTIALPHAETETKRRVTPLDVTGARVLVIDDNAVNRSILLEQMASWGFDSCAAESGPEGIAVLKAVNAHGLKVDCIILDYQMPEMTGDEVARIIRETRGVADTPIVMLTSVDQSLGAPGYRNLHIDAHLIKPARSSALLEALVSAIQKQRSHALDSEKPAEQAQPEAPASPPARVQAPPAPRPELRISPRAAAGPHRVDILVAEDNEVNQLVFTQILDETGLTYEIVSNGRLAVEACRTMNPRMILMDVSMPEMNGLEATAAIRETQGDRNVPIVGVTAHALKGDRERCLEAGMDDYLSKPISPKALTQKIERWMEGGQVRDTA